MSTIEVTMVRLSVSLMLAYLVLLLTVQRGTTYGSERAYLLLGILPSAAVFFLSLVFLWPAVGL